VGGTIQRAQKLRKHPLVSLNAEHSNLRQTASVSRGRGEQSKGKRNVTFDLNRVVTIKKGVQTRKKNMENGVGLKDPSQVCLSFCGSDPLFQ